MRGAEGDTNTGFRWQAGHGPESAGERDLECSLRVASGHVLVNQGTERN